VQQGGYLKIFSVDSSNDAGIYTCSVISRSGEKARREIQLNVNSPPVIESFSFPKNLQEGGRAQVTCSVSAGDMPIYFSWQKDGAPIPLSLQVQEKKEEFFSLLVFKDITSKHSGRYTCFAMNTAAKVNSSADLLVKVSPQWSVEPQDMAVMVGNQLKAQCEAHGYPSPTISWFRGLNKQSKDFEPLRVKNTSLVVNFATASDEGYYMCHAHNDIGAGLKKVFYVNINEPARFDSTMRNVSSKRGGSVNLDCRAYGDEPLSIVWTHNNARIDMNNYR
jgi:Down syndrome cell adhesion molecule